MENERENGKGILFGVLGIMTLIIAILGASLAYFTATDRSDENAVQVQAATVSIVYEQGDIIDAGNLIPATQAVAQAAYAKEGTEQCKDNSINKQPVCAVFEFHATNSNPNTPVDLEGKIITTTTGNPTHEVEGVDVQYEFDNLKYIVFDTTDPEDIKTIGAPITFAKSGNSSSLFDNGLGSTKITMDGGQTRTFEVLIWLNELATSEQLADENDNVTGNQNYEQGLKYTGTVEISVVGSSDKITGQME